MAAGIAVDHVSIYRWVQTFTPEVIRDAAAYANNRVEADHGRLQARLRPMRGLTLLASARTVWAGHACAQNLRRGHCAISADLAVQDRVRFAFDELAFCL